MARGKITDDEKKIILESLSLSNEELAAKLNRTPGSIRNFLSKNHIQRTPEQLKEIRLRFALKGDKNPSWKGGRSTDNYFYRKRSRERFPEHDRARQIVSKALRAGFIRRLPCEICGYPETEAHHANYQFALELNWLCLMHHRMLHSYGFMEVSDLRKVLAAEKKSSNSVLTNQQNLFD